MESLRTFFCRTALQDHKVLPPCSLSLCLFLSPAQQPVAFHGSKSGCAVTWGRLAKLRPQQNAHFTHPFQQWLPPTPKHPHTQINRPLSRQSAKQLLLALLRLICKVLFVIVTFPAVDMSSQAMSPICHCEQTLFMSVQHTTWPNCSLWDQTQNILKRFYIHFLSIFFRNCFFPPAFWLLRSTCSS